VSTGTVTTEGLLDEVWGADGGGSRVLDSTTGLRSPVDEHPVKKTKATETIRNNGAGMKNGAFG
jgi:hypothetical protein